MSLSPECCWPHVYRFALSLTRDVHLAEDLTQDTMTRACRRAHQLRSDHALRGWLLRIAANLWRDRLRARHGRTEPCGEEVAAQSDSPAVHLGRKEDVVAALEAVQSLPPTQRGVLHLYAVENLSLPEIADIMGLKPATARVHLCLARRSLRNRLPHLWRELQSNPTPGLSSE